MHVFDSFDLTSKTLTKLLAKGLLRAILAQ